jgi:endonuclease III
MGLLKSRNDAGGLPAVAQQILAKAEKRRAPRRKSSTKLTCSSPSTSPLEGRVDRWVAVLIHWFDTHARKLPWRRTLDPYGIWISEIMLQQTQVKTVIPYWERWMHELPDATALAGARPERVLKLWEGLGYYTRARNLQRAAQEIVQQHGGSFPTEFSAILALPGIGRYTAGAISSIAFSQPNQFWTATSSASSPGYWASKRTRANAKHSNASGPWQRCWCKRLDETFLPANPNQLQPHSRAQVPAGWSAADLARG